MDYPISAGENTITLSNTVLENKKNLKKLKRYRLRLLE